jgi:hypothetical protein
MYYEKPAFMNATPSGPTPEEITQWEQEQYLNQIELLREMIYEQAIPEILKKRFWGLITKFLVLTNIDKDDERIFLNEFDIVIASGLGCMSVDDFTLELDNEINNLRVWFRACLLRAKGPQRERVMQVLQINENINRQQGMGQGVQKKGFWNKLGGMLGKKAPAQPATVDMPNAAPGGSV